MHACIDLHGTDECVDLGCTDLLVGLEDGA